MRRTESQRERAHQGLRPAARRTTIQPRPTHRIRLRQSQQSETIHRFTAARWSRALYAALIFRGLPPSRPLALEAFALVMARRMSVEPRWSANSAGTETSASKPWTRSP
jgi:hypothetical protein